MTGTHPDQRAGALRSIVEEALEPLADRVAAVEDQQKQILEVVQNTARRSGSSSRDLPGLCAVQVPCSGTKDPPSDRPGGSPPQKTESAPAALLNSSQLAEWLGIRRSQVYRLRDRGALPAPVKFSQSLRWYRSAIERWLAEGCPPALVGRRHKGGRK